MSGLHVVLFPDALSKARWLDNQASLDAATPIIRETARLLASDSRPPSVVQALAIKYTHRVRPTEPIVPAAVIAKRLELQPHGDRDQVSADGILAQRLHRWVRDAIAYVRDWHGREEFADARTVIRRGYDDCDGKSRAFVALVRALYLPRLQARIRPVFTRRMEFVHVQAEVKWPGSQNDRRSFDGGWLLAEMIVAGVELGDDPVKLGRRDAGGGYLMAGPNPSTIEGFETEHV